MERPRLPKARGLLQLWMWPGQAADKDEKAKRWCRSISVPKQITRTRRIIQASSI